MSNEAVRGVLKRLLGPWMVLPVAGALVLAAALASFPPVWQTEFMASPSAKFFEGASELVDLNTAGVAELTVLPGIGEGKAVAIVEYRDSHGAFATVDELLNVPGIGEKTLEALREMVCL